MRDMDEQQLAVIEARATSATPGPWASERGYEQADPGAYVCSRAPDVAANIIVCDDTAPRVADADFIAAARSDVPMLAALVRDLATASAETYARDDSFRVCVLCDSSDDAGGAVGTGTVLHELSCPWARARLLAGMPVAIVTH